MNCDVRVAVRIVGILNSLIGFWNRPLLAVALGQKFIRCNTYENCSPKVLLLGL